jgi:L-gulonate 3-dehydrogenase
VERTGSGRKSRIAIVGSGLIGSSWAVVFARAGHSVVLHDANPAQLEASLAEADRALAGLDNAHLIDESPLDIRGRISIAPDLESAVRDADHVQENVSEDVRVKRAIYAELDRLAPSSAVLASSTSGLPASAWSESLPNRSRCLVAHPVNPPHLVPLVEISGAPWTRPDAIERTRQLMAAVGQKPIIVRKEIDGFILNRLQGALLREAFDLYREGYASIADIDTAVRDGLSLRWSFMGPFETIDLNAPGGIADYCQRYGPMYLAMTEGKPSQRWDNELVKSVEAERRAQLPETDLRSRRSWRDGKLMQLNAFRRNFVEASPANTGGE